MSKRQAIATTMLLCASLSLSDDQMPNPEVFSSPFGTITKRVVREQGRRWDTEEYETEDGKRFQTMKEAALHLKRERAPRVPIRPRLPEWYYYPRDTYPWLFFAGELGAGVLTGIKAGQIFGNALFNPKPSDYFLAGAFGGIGYLMFRMLAMGHAAESRDYRLETGIALAELAPSLAPLEPRILANSDSYYKLNQPPEDLRVVDFIPSLKALSESVKEGRFTRVEEDAIETIQKPLSDLTGKISAWKRLPRFFRPSSRVLRLHQEALNCQTILAALKRQE